MSSGLELTPAHHELVRRTHPFAEEVVRPAAAHYDQTQECPWEIVDAAAREGQAGTPEQLAHWAPLMFGEPGDIKLAALAVSEPQGGSDVANLQTRARKDGDEWVLDGRRYGSDRPVPLISVDRALLVSTPDSSSSSSGLKPSLLPRDPFSSSDSTGELWIEPRWFAILAEAISEISRSMLGGHWA